jgi:Zn-finger nucleic acid-binding protein
MFVGMQFCPNCGAKAARDLVDGQASVLACPGCKTEMRLVRVGPTSMYECPSCASSWLDSETFTALCTNREERGAVANIVGSSASAPQAAPGGAIRYVPCPQCTKLMNRTNFGHRSGVIIDVCKGHGAWFEARELRNVLAFVESGAFERARAEDAKQRADEERALHRSAGAPATGGASMSFIADDDSPAVDDSFLRRALQQLLF